MSYYHVLPSHKYNKKSVNAHTLQRQKHGELIHFEENTKLASNGFKDLTIPKHHGEIMELDPYSSSTELIERRFEKRLLVGKLKNNTVDGPGAFQEEALHRGQS